MCRRLLCRLVLVGCALAANDSLAQNITVTVKDSVTLEPLEGVAVSIYSGDELQVTETTNASGEALLLVPVDNEREAAPAKGWHLSHPYPNPTRDHARVHLATDAPGLVWMGLHDVLGRELLSRSAGVDAGGQSIELDLGGIPAGAYLLSLASDHGRQHVRLISKTEWTDGTPTIRIVPGYQEKMGAGLSPARKTASFFAEWEVRAELAEYIHARRRVDVSGDTGLTILLRHASVPDTVNSIGMAFRRIAKGTFQMGSNNGGSDEQPVHEVTLTRDFYLGVYEVTQKEWKAIEGTDPSHFTDCPGEVDDNCPVETVSWYDVIGYANALSVADGLAPCYDEGGNVVDPDAGGDIYRCRGYRLPTEAEWEYATRAGTTTEYSFGEDYPPTSLDSYSWHCDDYPECGDNSGFTTHPVGGKLPNPWGLYDVHGSVSEWVQGWWCGSYPSDSVTDPRGPGTGSYRVNRGGGWYGSAIYLRSADRDFSRPVSHATHFGFRLSRTIF